MRSPDNFIGFAGERGPEMTGSRPRPPKWPLEKVAQALPADRQTRDEVSQDDKTEHDVEQQASRLNDEATRGEWRGRPVGAET